MESDEAARATGTHAAARGAAPQTADPWTTPITRRALLTGVALSGVAALLAACGGGPTGSPPPSAPSPTVPPSTPGTQLSWASWSSYLDYDPVTRTFPTLEQFRSRYGTAVKYQEIIQGNESFFEALKERLEADQDPGFDLIVVTDWMAARIIRLGWAQQLDLGRMPNVAANLREELRRPVWDPGNDHHVPWLSGMTGLGFEPEVTGDITSLGALFAADARWKGKVEYLGEMRDALGLAMLANGDDPELPTRAAADRAVATIQRAQQAKISRRPGRRSPINDLTAGDAVLAMTWSGDLARAQLRRPGLRFAVADEGGMLWTDHVLVPKGSRQRLTAELLIDFCYQPEIAARIAATVRYLSPVRGAQEVLRSSDPDLAGDPLLFPTADTTARLRRFGLLSDADEAYCNEQFAPVLAAI